MRKSSVSKLLPVVLVAAFFLSAFTIVSSGKLSTGKSVLSESDSNSGFKGDEPRSVSATVQVGSQTNAGSSVGSSSGINLTQTFQREGQAEATDKPEAIETPEPKETPEAEADLETEVEVKDGTGEAKIKLHRGDAFQFEQQGLKVQIQGRTPLSVNPQTKELTVTTPAGARTVTTLPDQAVQNLVNGGVFSVQSGINLTTDANGNPVYEINGVKYEKLLGLFTIGIDKTGQVSAQNGQIIGVSQSSFSKLLDSLSF